MKIVSALALAMMLSASVQANVIGPNKDGIYKVDQYGEKKSTEKTKLNDKCDYLIIKNQKALLMHN